MLNPFSSITTAGLLLPLDLLTRVSSMDRALPGMTPADYHVPGSVRLNEAATSAYSRALACWKSFRKKFNALPASDAGTTLTRDEWLLPLFDCLGYGRLQTKRAITIDEKDYPISHAWEHVPIHLLSARLPLDKRTQNVSGAATRSPYSLVQELLNRSSQHRWGFVSNGLKLYILRDNASLTRSANVEFDLESMMDGEYHADFTALYLICHQSRLEIQPIPIVDSKSSSKKKPKSTKAKKDATHVAEKSPRYSLNREEDSRSVPGLELDEEALEAEEPARLGLENCWLEAWTKLSGEQGTRAREKLRDGVQLAIEALGAGFYTCASNVTLHERLRSGELSTQDYYRQLLRIVYRLLMLMVAEDKRTESGQNLLHPNDTPAHIRDRYNQFYSVSRIRKLANERRGTPHRDLYEGLKATFMKLRVGYQPLGIPGIGSFLFSDTSTPDLDNAQIANEALLDAFRHLCFTDDTSSRGGSIRRAVDFANLGSEELGSIYESLLELHPEIDSQDGPFALRTAAGNERKTSGSYYTPISLINCLLDSALDPVVNQAIEKAERMASSEWKMVDPEFQRIFIAFVSSSHQTRLPIPHSQSWSQTPLSIRHSLFAKQALLALKVCDPACGSGHFLIAATNRMALHLARLETQDTEPTTLQIQHAKRQIIGRCIYGVDINEMAVELCKVSLWMEALEPGKPFSFLENHIKCGNSLLGATPRLLKDGIPDEAFNPIEGDDKAVCTQLKRENKRERADYKFGKGYLFEPFYKLGNIADRFAKLSAVDDDSLGAITNKQKQYEELIKGTPYLNARFWADTWCSAFVWKKDDTDLGRLCPTERKFREIERSPHSASTMIHEQVQELARRYQFLHWHLAFPDVFVLPKVANDAENEHTGWNRGFDIVLGNPPWEMVEVNEKEFFAKIRPDIANATTAKDRLKMIAGLATENPPLKDAFSNRKRFINGSRHFIQSSSRYVSSAVGRINSYPLFVELGALTINTHGRVGLIVPSAVAMDAYNAKLFGWLCGDNRLVSLFDFENRDAIFPGVHRSYRFCLLTLTVVREDACATIDLCFFAHDTAELSDDNRRIKLTTSDLLRFSPYTLAPPMLLNAKDGQLAAVVYHRNGVLRSNVVDRWPVSINRMLSLSDKGDIFSHATQSELLDLSEWRRLYTGKSIHQYTHRYSTWHTANWTATATESMVNPSYSISTEYCARLVEVEKRTLGKLPERWRIGYRDVCRATDERTAIAAIIPEVGCDTHCRNVYFDSIEESSPLCFVANFNSFILDYFCRQKVVSIGLGSGIVEQLPFLPLKSFRANIAESSTRASEFIATRVIELSYTAWDLQEFAIDCECHIPPFQWNDDRRFQIRGELDAAFFHLYLGPNSEWGAPIEKEKSQGVNETLLDIFPTPRDAASYIMDTFPIVRRKDEAKYGEYRTKRVILEIYDQMTEIIEANEAIRAANPGKSEVDLRPLLRSYQSPLNPPPGPPTDANGKFIPYADWTDEIHRQYASVIHPPKRSLVALSKLELIRDLLLILEAWNTPASISAIEPALILMRDDRARAILSGDRRSTQHNPVKREPVRIEGLQTVYLTLEANQTISKVGESGYRLAKPEVTAQFPDSIKVKARQAVAIVKSFADPGEASTAVASECCFDFELAGESNG